MPPPTFLGLFLYARERLADSLEQHLEADRWRPQGPPHILPDGWPDKTPLGWTPGIPAEPRVLPAAEPA
jgi:hypothetical protein